MVSNYKKKLSLQKAITHYKPAYFASISCCEQLSMQTTEIFSWNIF